MKRLAFSYGITSSSECVKVKKTELEISIPQLYKSIPNQGVKQYLNKKLLSYFTELGGRLLGWDITEIQESKYKPFLTDNVVFQLEGRFQVLVLEAGYRIPAKIIEVRGDRVIASVFQTFGAEIKINGDLPHYSPGDMITFKYESALEDTNSLVFRGTLPQPCMDTNSEKERDFLSISAEEVTVLNSNKCDMKRASLTSKYILPNDWSRKRIKNYIAYVAPNGDVFKKSTIRKALCLYDFKQQPSKYGFTKEVTKTCRGGKKILYVSGETTYTSLSRIYRVLNRLEMPNNKNAEASGIRSSLPNGWSREQTKTAHCNYISPTGEIFKFMGLQKALRLYDFKQQPEKYGFSKQVEKLKSGQQQVSYVFGEISYVNLNKIYNEVLKEGNFKNKSAETIIEQPPQKIVQKTKSVSKQHPTNITPIQKRTRSNISRTLKFEIDRESVQTSNRDKDKFLHKLGITSRASKEQPPKSNLSKSFQEESYSKIIFENVDTRNKTCQNLQYVEQIMDSTVKLSEKSNLNNETEQMLSGMDFTCLPSENINVNNKTSNKSLVGEQNLDCTEKLVKSVNKTVDITADYINISLNTSAILSTKDINMPCRQGGRKRSQSTPYINNTANSSSKRPRRSCNRTETELPDEVGMDIANENPYQLNLSEFND